MIHFWEKIRNNTITYSMNHLLLTYLLTVLQCLIGTELFKVLQNNFYHCVEILQLRVKFQTDSFENSTYFENQRIKYLYLELTSLPNI